MTAAHASLEEKVRFLSDPSAYPDASEGVEVVETHMAFVFLTAGHAWKMKKPVVHPFLDFRTLTSRHRDCLEEVRLNRRLALRVYLGVVPLTRSPGGGLALGGEGTAVEWLVHMVRLPAHRMLDRAIGRGMVRPDEVTPAAELLTAFYRGAPPVPPPTTPYREHFLQEVERLRDELSRPAGQLPTDVVDALVDGFRAFLRGSGSLLEERVRAGRIVEGHGDLRPEHVHLGPPPAVIDCLEFDRGLRTVDAAEDLGFLWLECERLGAPQVGRWFLDVYSRGTGDRPPPQLLHFYRAFRAFVRAKLAVWHLWDGIPAEREHWYGRARTYLDLARRHMGCLTSRSRAPP